MPPKVQWNISRRISAHTDGIWDVSACPWNPRYAAAASAGAYLAIKKEQSDNMSMQIAQPPFLTMGQNQ